MIQKDCASRNEGGRGITSIDASMQGVEDYIEKRRERLITATRNETSNTRTNRTETTSKQKWEEKQLYGCFKPLTSDISHEKAWTWLRKGNLKKETESLLIVTQNKAMKTHHVKARIVKTQQNSRCRLCSDPIYQPLRSGRIWHKVNF